MGQRVGLALKVKENPSVQVNNQELFIYSSRAYGDWDPTVNDAPPSAGLRHFGRAFDPALDGGNLNSTTGWANHRFIDDSSNNLDPLLDTTGGRNVLIDSPIDWFGDENSYEQGNPTVGGSFTSRAHADSASIIEARPFLRKVNVDGLNHTVDNGDEITFKIDFGAVGSTLDTITFTQLRDFIPPNTEVVSFTQPAVAGTCSQTNATTISCVGMGVQPGGYSDSINVVVRVVGASANE